MLPLGHDVNAIFYSGTASLRTKVPLEYFTSTLTNCEVSIHGDAISSHSHLLPPALL